MRGLTPVVLFVVASTLAHSQFASMKKTARSMTLQTWEGRVDDMLAKRGGAKGAPAAWHAGDPHWDSAKAKTLAHIGKAVDDLLEAPDPERIATKSFTTILDDKDAGAAAATLGGKLGPELLNYSDYLTIAVALMTARPNTNPNDPVLREEVAEHQQKAGVHRPPDDAALTAAAMEKPMRQFMSARSSAVQAVVSALDGQLNLFVFDRQEALAREIDGAIRDCAKTHGK